MRILVLGSGGREHAMARALQSNGDMILVAPGNGGTPDRRDIDPCNPEQVVALCRDEKIDLVLIGPESALAAGVSDARAKVIAAPSPPATDFPHRAMPRSPVRELRKKPRHGAPRRIFPWWSKPMDSLPAKAWSFRKPLRSVTPPSCALRPPGPSSSKND
jgi:hypothetical protein